MGDIFRGGVPYSVDVKRLNEAFPAPSLVEGRVIHHSQLEEILNVPRGDQRYYGVVNSWIHKAKIEHGIYIIWKQGDGIEVLDPAKLLAHAGSRTRQKIRQTGRAINTYRFVDRSRLNTSGQKAFDHQKRVLTVFGDAMQTVKKDLPIALEPIQSLPKPKLDVTPKPKERNENNETGSDRIN